MKQEWAVIAAALALTGVTLYRALCGLDWTALAAASGLGWLVVVYVHRFE